MPIVRHADLVALDRVLRGAFMGAYESPNYKPKWPLWAGFQNSTSKKNTYPMVLDPASIREWTEGERSYNGIVIEGANVTNQLWELSYEIPRVEYEDDATGVTRQAVSQVKSGAAKYLRHPDKLCTNVLVNNSTCFDGLALFHASHKVNPADAASATVSNTDSGALTANNAATARKVLVEMPTSEGDAANDAEKIALIVPPALELTARKIAQADIVIHTATATDTAESNVYRGMYDVIVLPRLGAAFSGSDSYWYMADVTDPEDRAVIFQERQKVEMVSMFSPSDPAAFELDRFRWGTRARYTAAAANWHKIVRRTG